MAKTFGEQLEKILKGICFDGGDYSPGKCPTCTQAKTAIITLIMGVIPEAKDCSGEFQVQAIYRRPPQDGEEVSFTHINYDERRGWNALRSTLIKELEGK